MGWFGEAVGALLGGSSASSSSSSSGGYGGFIDSLFESGQTAPRMKARTRDEGLYGLGSNNEYQPVGSTFKAYGNIHRNETEALRYLDDTTCYSGSLVCPICGDEKNKPSEVELCKKAHRLRGYDC